MNETGDGERTADPAHRRERGIEAYARIFDVPEKDVPTAMASRVGPFFAEEVFLAAGGPAWFPPGPHGPRAKHGDHRRARRPGRDR
jgi:4-carboxymuconolactone decarboxylase